MYRKHKNAIFLLIVASLFLLLTACWKNEQTAEELMRYHNGIWTELEKKRNELSNSMQLIYVEETEGKQAAGEYLEEIMLPEMKSFIDEEKAIELKDDSVIKLHDLLIDADEFVYNTLKVQGTAYYSGKIDGDELFEMEVDVKKMYDEFLDYREKLMKKNKLVIDHVRNDKGSYEEKMVNKSDAKNLDGIKWGEP